MKSKRGKATIPNMVVLINQHRASIGLKPIQLNMTDPMGQYENQPPTWISYEDCRKANLTLHITCEVESLATYNNFGAVSCFLRGDASGIF